MPEKSPIQEAYEEVKGLALPAEYALKAFEVILQNKLGAAQTSGAKGGAGTGAKPSIPDPSLGGSPVDKVAAALGLSAEDAANIFEFEDGKPVLRVRTTALPASAKAATEELAVILAAAFEALGLEMSSTDLQKALDDFGKFNSSNFAAYLSQTPADQLSIKRKAKEKIYPIKVRQPGRERAREIASRLAGAE